MQPKKHEEIPLAFATLQDIALELAGRANAKQFVFWQPENTIVSPHVSPRELQQIGQYLIEWGLYLEGDQL